MIEGETYLEIVWKQFRKNRLAYWSLWLLAVLVLVAIFAPLISSAVPLVFSESGQTTYPWFRALFHTDQVVDFLFNMALLVFLPWLVAALILNVRAKRRGVRGPHRAALALFEFLVLLIAVIAFFTVPQQLGFAGFAPPSQWMDNGQFLDKEFHEPPGTIRAVHVLMPFDPTATDLNIRLQSPGFRKSENLARAYDAYPHWLGTETGGIDVLTKMIYGTRLALTVGIVAVGIYLSIGVILGALAGYYGGWIDILISRSIEVVLVFPSFFLILTMVAYLGQSIFIIMGVIGLLGWPSIARLTRGEVLKQRSLDYTTAAEALGVSHLRIAFRHVLPNSLGPALVSVPFGIASAIITEASLSLLGFGVRPPAPSWGSLLKQASEDYANWWLVLFPSLAVFFTVTIFNLIGSGLRDAMDPRLRI